MFAEILVILVTHGDKFQVCEDEKDKRQDLYIKARSYQGQLGARKAKMMKESDFHVVG